VDGVNFFAMKALVIGEKKCEKSKSEAKLWIKA